MDFEKQRKQNSISKVTAVLGTGIYVPDIQITGLKTSTVAASEDINSVHGRINITQAIAAPVLHRTSYRVIGL